MSLKFSCDQTIKIIGLILRRNMFGVLLSFFLLLLLVNMCKKANELVRKQQISYFDNILLT